MSVSTPTRIQPRRQRRVILSEDGDDDDGDEGELGVVARSNNNDNLNGDGDDGEHEHEGEGEGEDEDEYTPARRTTGTGTQRAQSQSQSRSRPSATGRTRRKGAAMGLSMSGDTAGATGVSAGLPGSRRRSTRLSLSTTATTMGDGDESTALFDGENEEKEQIPPVPALPASMVSASMTPSAPTSPEKGKGRRGRRAGASAGGGADAGVGIAGTTGYGRARSSRVSGLMTPSASATPEPMSVDASDNNDGTVDGKDGDGATAARDERDGSSTPTPRPTVADMFAASPSGTPLAASTPAVTMEAAGGGGKAGALADITSMAINEQGPVSPTPSTASQQQQVSNRHVPATPTVTRIDARSTTMLEKPMDIAARARERAYAEAAEKDGGDVTAIAAAAAAATTTTTSTTMAAPSATISAMPEAVAPAQAGPKPRIVITYLVLTNFKSYAGRQEVGPFHTSFSSVVGPNGSGKSNVIDSLLFVFGFRASKMRQGKISALIHNSAAFPNLDHCEVEVHFQEVIDNDTGNSNNQNNNNACRGEGGKSGAMAGTEVIPDSKLVVSRKAFKNNASKYYINGKESNFTTVTTLLRDRGIDLDHKRFLILQGEVESIAQMKPKAPNEHEDGLLEYLEDIIGTSKYKTPIEESATETEALNEVCVERSSRVQHVEKEKNSLEEKKNAALAYIRDENELATKQSALYQIHIEDCNNNLQITQETASKLQEELDDELRKHEGSEEGIKQLQKQYKASVKEYETLEKQTQAFLKEIAKLDKETVKFEEKKKFLGSKQKKLEKSLQASSFAIAESQNSARQCADDIERNTAQIAELEGDFGREEAELARIRDGLKGKTQGLSDAIAVKQKTLEPWKEKINEKQSAIAVAQSELEILRERENAGATAVAEVEAKIASYEDSKAAKAAELAQCKQQKKSLEQEIARVNQEMQDLGAREPKVRAKASSARQKADEARASLSATQTQGNVLTGLMRLKESGRIDGFHGRLGDLGAIDEEYDVAISTACPALNNLVVDSVDVGQKCIDYLRKNNLGRANFILLDRLPQRDLSPSAVELPEGDDAPRLFDLVRARDERFRPAFYSVLQNTLVARDLEQANRIAYGGARRWRVVTRDGQLIDKSGTMSGGGTRVAKGGMSATLSAGDAVSKEQVSKLEHDRDELEASLQTFKQQQESAEREMKRLAEELPRVETQAQKIALELESYERNITDARRRIEELGAEQRQTSGGAGSDKGRMASLEKQIAALEKDAAALREESAGVEAEIKDLQDKIMEIGGVRLRGQKAKVDGLKEQMDTLMDEMSSAEVNKTKAEKQKVKMEKAVKDAEAELKSIRAEMEKVDGDMRLQMQDASGSKKQAEEAQEVRVIERSCRWFCHP